MDFGTRAAGTCITHFPEVVMFVAIEDMVFRQELFPVRGGFVVPFQSFFGTSFEYGGIQIFRIYLQYIYQIFPCPADSFFLEVISERPVAQHFEHSMVVGIMSHFFQVIVLAAYTQTFL